MTDILSAKATSFPVSPLLNNSRLIGTSAFAPPRGAQRSKELTALFHINWMIRGLCSITSPILQSKFIFCFATQIEIDIIFCRYWSVKRMELKAMLENVGPFHIFFTLSCGDRRQNINEILTLRCKCIFSRYSENFTAFLRDHHVTYVYVAGNEECRIDGVTIDEFFEKHSSAHEHIRKNILLATRNFQFRVQTFVKNVIHNKKSELRVKYHSYRVEFQMRGRTVIKCNISINFTFVLRCGSYSRCSLS